MRSKFTILIFLVLLSLAVFFYASNIFSLREKGNLGISVSELAPGKNLIFTDYDQASDTSSVYVSVSGRPIKICSYKGEGLTQIKESPDGKKLAIIPRGVWSEHGLMLVDESDYAKVVTISKKMVVSSAWSNDGDKIFFITDENDYQNSDPRTMEILAEKYKLKEYDLKNDRIREISNYRDISGVKNASSLGITRVDGDNLFLSAWGEDSVFNIRIWKYNLATKKSSLVVDLQHYQNEKYKKSTIVGWSPDMTRLYFVGDLGNAGNDERLAWYSLIDNSVTEIAQMHRGYQALISPDSQYIAYTVEEGSYPNRNISLMVVNLIDNQTVLTDNNFSPGDDIELKHWLPDSKKILVKVNNTYRLYNIVSLQYQNVSDVNDISIVGWY